MEGDPASLRLAEAAVARLYHDLSGSLGAVLNGLDLAAARDSIAEEAIEVAMEAARDVAARLKLARALWDSATPMDLAHLAQLADGLPNRGRLELDLSGLHGRSLPAPAGRLVLAALMMAAEALHGAGVISVAGDAAQGIVVMIDGPRAAWPAELPALLADPTDGGPPDPRGLAARLVGLFTRAARARASLLLSSGAPDRPPPLLISLH